jgi:hypothetical protein
MPRLCSSVGAGVAAGDDDADKDTAAPNGVPAAVVGAKPSSLTADKSVSDAEIYG